jgi:hypothetical protein
MEGQNDDKSTTKEQHQLTSEWGKAMKREEALAGQSLLYAEEREREGWCGPARRRPDVSVEPDRRSHGACRVPLFCIADEWASVGFRMMV